MTSIAIVPEPSTGTQNGYRAIAGEAQSVGETVGQALDALTAHLGGAEGTTLVVVQRMRPDAWFTAQQRQRLAELMECWRTARDAGAALPPEEQAELDALVEAELRAASQRSADLVRQLPS